MAGGNLYYNVLQLSDPGVVNPWSVSDVLGAWLVRIRPDDSATLTPWANLFPSGTALPTMCEGTFSLPGDPLPWPPTPSSHPPQTPCGTQRPPLNVAPAIGSDGTIYTVSRAHFHERYGYLLAVNSDLTPKWAASLRGLLNDGCGVTVPFGTAPVKNVCRTGTTVGVDPATNDLPAARLLDAPTASPTVAPDGVLFGVNTMYNRGRGHLLKFSSAGQFQTFFDFGWDSTVAIFPHDGTYSVIAKDNHYEGTFYITQLDPNLQPEWKFENTNTQSCQRNPDDTITCVDVGHTFEWCVNALVVDANGVAYALSEDGNLYAFGGRGHSGEFTTPLHQVFLNLALGAAYTPLSVGPEGTIYTLNDGHLFAVSP